MVLSRNYEGEDYDKNALETVIYISPTHMLSLLKYKISLSEHFDRKK